MSFRPNPGDILGIDVNTYRIAEHPAAPGMAYGQSGRRGTVYRLVDDSGAAWALKVFLRQFREPRLVGQAERIQSYASLPGLRACERQVLTGSRHVDLIREHRDLAYAVLMPWISGLTWMEVVAGEGSFTQEDSLRIARNMTRVLLGMEERGLAHCDLSGPNLILATAGSIELVDLEEMYSPDLVRPEMLPGGSPGYTHKTAPEGLWHAKADRFAGAVILGEMLCWCDERVQDLAWGEGYFDPNEVQTNCERYHLLKAVLQDRWGFDLAMSFERVWFSDSLVDCITFTEWLAALPEAVPDGGQIDTKVEVPAREKNDSYFDDEVERDEAIKTQAEGFEVEEEPVPSEEETWTCPFCRREAWIGLDVCPFCEQGKRDDEHIPETVAEAGLDITKAEERKRVLVWVGISAIVVLTGVIGGILFKRATTQAVIAATTATEQMVAVMTDIAQLTEKPVVIMTLSPTLAPTTTLTPTPRLGAGSTALSETDAMVMVFIPEGPFLMGSAENDYQALESFKPQHKVYLDAFWIDKTEITNTMYHSCAKAGACTLPRIPVVRRDYRSTTPYFLNNAYRKFPVVWVTWYQARDYCAWAGRRLPTEAEWEKAARGIDGQRFPWGNESPSCILLNYSSCINFPSEVGAYPEGASPYGALDMAGNVWEWVADWFNDTYYEQSPSNNPAGPSVGTERVYRGGAYLQHLWWQFTYYRASSIPNGDDSNLGFRCALDASP